MNKESTALRTFGILAEAFAWGMLGAVVLAITAFVFNTVGERMYSLNPSHSISGIFYGMFGLFGGFIASAGARLARPRWTSAQMCVAVLALAFLCAVGTLQLVRWDATYEHRP
jgi:hypothetical protein